MATTEISDLDRHLKTCPRVIKVGATVVYHDDGNRLVDSVVTAEAGILLKLENGDLRLVEEVELDHADCMATECAHDDFRRIGPGTYQCRDCNEVF